MDDDCISILILNYNGLHYLGNCINSIMNQTYPKYKITVVDNCSNDGSLEFVRKKYPFVNILPLDKNYGFAKAYNIAISNTNSKYIVLLNNDTVVDKDWLKWLFNTIKSDEKIALCSSKILFYDNPNKIQYAGNLITPIGEGMDIRYAPKSEVPQNTGVASGCSVILRKEVFDNLGGFDDTYFCYSEDVDLSWRCWMMGYRVVYDPRSIVLHKVGGTSGGRKSCFNVYNGQKNRSMNMIKNFGIKKLFMGLLISAIYDIYRIIIFTFHKSDWKYIKMILSADYYLVTNLLILLKKRKEVQQKRIINDKELGNDNIFGSLYWSLVEFKKLNNHG